MNITITITTEQQRSVAHILMLDGLRGSNVGKSIQDYLTEELQSTINKLSKKAEQSRSELLKEVIPTLDVKQSADLADFLINLRSTGKE